MQRAEEAEQLLVVALMIWHWWFQGHTRSDLSYGLRLRGVRVMMRCGVSRRRMNGGCHTEKALSGLSGRSGLRAEMI